MKILVLAAFTAILLFTACRKDDIVTEPNILMCGTGYMVPIRILSAYGIDLLNRSYVPSGKLTLTHKDIQTFAAATYNIQQLTPTSDTFFFSIPMVYTMNSGAATHVIYLHRPSRTDTISIQYSPASSKLYGIDRFSFNRRDYPITELLKGRGVMGYEIRED